MESSNSSIGYSALESGICGIKTEVAWGLPEESGRGKTACPRDWHALKRVQGLGEHLHPGKSKAAVLLFRLGMCGFPMVMELRIPNADGAGSDREKVAGQLG